MDENTTERDPVTPPATELTEAVEAPAVLPESDPVPEAADPEPRPRRPRKAKPAPVLPPEEYLVRNSAGAEVLCSKEIFDCIDALKKLPPGYEMVRKSDGVRLSYNTRQKPNENLGPTAPFSYKKR